MKKVLCFFITAALFCGIFSGCYDRLEIDELAYVITIGIDKGKTNKLKMTLQIAVPKTIGGSSSGGGGGGGGGEQAVNTVTIETPTIYSGLNMANSFINRQLNLSHMKVMVFSKEYATEGVEDLVMALPRGRQFRPNVQIIVTQGQAEDFIKSVKPTLEVNPAKYYELMFQSYKYTGFTSNNEFFKFYNKFKSSYEQPVATLAGVSRYKKSDEFRIEDSTVGRKGRSIPMEGDFIAGSIPKYGDVNSEFMGLAVFNNSKMVGELDGGESILYGMITGEYSYAYFTLPDPIEKDKFVILSIRQSRKPWHRTKMVDGKAMINVVVKLEADILVIQSGINYENIDMLHILEDSYDDFITEGIKLLFKRTTKEFKTDIFAFGEDVKRSFLTWKEWEDVNWLDIYKDSSIDVNVEVKIRSPGLQIRSSTEHKGY